MKGIVLNGKEPVLKQDLPIPPIANGEVKVRVIYSTVNGHEIELASSKSARLLGKIMGARGEVQTGLEFTGVVETKGQTFSVGDKVFGYIDMTKGWKPHAEYISIPEQYLAHLPDALSESSTAALPMSAMTALTALRDIAKVQTGDSVLIFGASGGVGITAIQIAKILGATVTAVASAKHHELLTELGADKCIDYRTTNVSDMTGQYSAILEMTTQYRLKQIKHLLKDNGIFMPANPFNNLLDFLFNGRLTKWLFVDKGNTEQLNQIAAWAKLGLIKPVIDQEFELTHYKDAFKRALERGKAGRVLLKMAD